jgi:hypothetical protein
MSVNIPPNPNVSTFNNLYWITSDVALTEEIANKRYLRFPVAQGTENLQTTNVNGLLTCNSSIDIATGTLTFPDNTIQSTAANYITDTNTDATFFSQLKVLSLHLIYWYTRTNTDAARGRGKGMRGGHLRRLRRQEVLTLLALLVQKYKYGQ